MGWQDRDYASRPVHPGPAYRTARPGFPWGGSIVTTLIIINVAIFAAGALFPGIHDLLHGTDRATPFGVQSIAGWAELRADQVMHGQVWRLITAQYLHAGMWHLFFNMLVLHFLGRPLERMWSPRKFFTIYTLCGLAGNVFYTALAVQGAIPTWMPAVGASGCIYGMLGAVAVLFPTATVWVYFLFPMRIRTLAFVLAGIAFLSIVTRGQNFGGEACHLAGLAFGVWWAMKGDAWWSSTRWRIPRGRGRARRVKPSKFEAKIAERQADQETIDRILRKVYDGGIHTLTEREKRALQEATDRQRTREAQAGRVDRL